MIKLIYSLIIAAFWTAVLIPDASAKTITSDVAQTVAVNFFKQNADVEVKTVSLAYTETSSSGEAVYFVFSINSESSQNGFVIIVADDALYPVIGYSTEGSFVVPAPSSNAGYWMEQRKKEIITNRMQNVQATSEISAQWKAYLNSYAVAPRVASIVSPLVQTLWDQGSPYNALCPGGSQTGCVATAMAQIMRYWKFPIKGTGSSSYTSTSNGVLSVNYGNTTYNWNNMPTGNVTSANNDVATIMYQCGVSVDMIYSPSVSVSYMITGDNPTVCAQISYSKYFGYNSTTIQGLRRTNYTDQNWINLIETELNAGRPLQYSGVDNINGGHGWVCDGYDANNYLHMNWGWSGAYNGYFSINLLNPDIFDFSESWNEVLIGIEPKSIAGVPSISDAESFTIYPNPASDQLTIQTSSSQNSATAIVSIINVLGQEVLSNSLSLGEGRGEVLDISNLSAGMYFLEMKTESAIHTKRFIKE